jgi:hypothetical protein
MSEHPNATMRRLWDAHGMTPDHVEMSDEDEAALRRMDRIDSAVRSLLRTRRWKTPMPMLKLVLDNRIPIDPHFVELVRREFMRPPVERREP